MVPVRGGNWLWVVSCFFVLGWSQDCLAGVRIALAGVRIALAGVRIALAGVRIALAGVRIAWLERR